MAATYDLDVSMALDDLAWHFINHDGSMEFAEETVLGLRELEAPEAADIFHAALEIIAPHWQELEDGMQAKAAHDWLDSKGIQASIIDLRKDIEGRDQRDRTRQVAPLVAAEDALALDNSAMSVDECVELVLEWWRQRNPLG